MRCCLCDVAALEWESADEWACRGGNGKWGGCRKVSDLSIPCKTLALRVALSSFHGCSDTIHMPFCCLSAQAWAKEQGLSGSLAELCHEDRVKKMLLGDLNATAKAGKLKVGGCGCVSGKGQGGLGGLSAAEPACPTMLALSSQEAASKPQRPP